MVKISLEYSNVESEEIDPDELFTNPQNYLIFKLTKRFRCKKCNSFLTIRKSKTAITFRCGCGCRVFYPTNKLGVAMTTFITKEEHDKKVGLWPSQK